jgi:two-component system, LuxR family, response regulator FixJ
MNAPHVVVVDDDEAVLDSMLGLIASAGYQVRGFISAMGLFAAIEELPRSCVITDVRMPQVDGLSLIRKLREVGCEDWPVVVISGHADVPMAVEAMRLGAANFLEKPVKPQNLIEVLSECAARFTLPDDVGARAVHGRYGLLTNREREITGFLIAGHSSKKIGATLGISPRTADGFRASVLKKMAVENVAALATLAERHGLV